MKEPSVLKVRKILYVIPAFASAKPQGMSEASYNACPLHRARKPGSGGVIPSPPAAGHNLHGFAFAH